MHTNKPIRVVTLKTVRYDRGCHALLDYFPIYSECLQEMPIWNSKKEKGQLPFIERWFVLNISMCVMCIKTLNINMKQMLLYQF